jgi:hypothetical protein
MLAWATRFFAESLVNGRMLAGALTKERDAIWFDLQQQ